MPRPKVDHVFRRRIPTPPPVPSRDSSWRPVSWRPKIEPVTHMPWPIRYRASLVPTEPMSALRKDAGFAWTIAGAHRRAARRLARLELEEAQLAERQRTVDNFKPRPAHMYGVMVTLLWVLLALAAGAIWLIVLVVSR